MAFTPRLTEPSYSDANWIHTSYGGKNQCIIIDSSSGSVLPNCFSGDTEIITDRGILSLKSLSGTFAKVPTADGWHSAYFKSFGKQQLWQVKLHNRTYYATPNHLWPIYDKNNNLIEFVYTYQLRSNMRIRYTFIDPVEFTLDLDGFHRGVVVGLSLTKYRFNKIYAKMSTYLNSYIDVSKLDGNSIECAKMLTLPATTTLDYNYSYLAGIFSICGTVSSYGTCVQFDIKGSFQDVTHIVSICGICNIRVSSVSKTKGIWHIRLWRYTVNRKFYVNPDHLSRLDRCQSKQILFTNVISVKPTDRCEEVYCAVEPITHTITLATGELTGQCVGYAWGRFMEIIGSTPTLSKGDAGTWYGYTSDGYKRGSTPQVGSVLCWAKPGSWGHVAIVEQINSDGTFTASQSSYNGRRFWTSTHSCKSPELSGFVFQGFIYNPACANVSNKLTDFLSEAAKHIGENGYWTWRTSGLYQGGPWCAAFVCAVAKTVGGILNVIIPSTFGAGSMARDGVGRGMGSWLRGPYHGNLPVPQPGDLILFRWGGSYYGDEYLSDHVGIVVSVQDNSVTTIEGNSGTYNNYTSTVKQKQYALNYTCINGYYRPDWARVGGYSSGIITGGTGGQLYDVVNTPEDAILREVGYVLDNEFSTQSSSIKLSVINYTTALGAFFKNSIRGGLSGDTSGVNTDQLSNVQRTIVEYFVNKGWPASSGIGIVANVQAECGFDISLSVTDSNGYLSSGMCMWNASNSTAMINYVGPDWRSDLSGQLDFLWYDMTQRNAGWLTYQLKRLYGISDSFVNVMGQLPNTESGARSAADYFVRCYENPASPDAQSVKRQQYASEWWNKIAIQQLP